MLDECFQCHDGRGIMVQCHLDYSPQNVLVAERGKIKIIELPRCDPKCTETASAKELSLGMYTNRIQHKEEIPGKAACNHKKGHYYLRYLLLVICENPKQLLTSQLALSPSAKISGSRNIRWLNSEDLDSGINVKAVDLR